ncbi:hypothetical protein ACJQWK_06894 [Exserohilum turcicum]
MSIFFRSATLVACVRIVTVAVCTAILARGTIQRHSSPVKPSPSLKLADSRRAGSRTLVSRQMNEEVLNLMLQRTERFILPRNFGDSDANNATWFHKFLAIVPGARGLNAVKYLDFPDMYLLKCVPRARALNNPSIDLAVACTNLRKLEMGFSAEKLTVLGTVRNNTRRARLTAIIAEYKLDRVLECANLEAVYMYKLPSGDGILEYPEVLQDLGKWTMKRFLVQRYPEKGIQVELASGCSIWKKPNCGLMITLDADDMKQVEKRIELRKDHQIY